jgi:hypothetical protein
VREPAAHGGEARGEENKPNRAARHAPCGTVRGQEEAVSTTTCRLGTHALNAGRERVGSSSPAGGGKGWVCAHTYLKTLLRSGFISTRGGAKGSHPPWSTRTSSARMLSLRAGAAGNDDNSRPAVAPSCCLCASAAQCARTRTSSFTRAPWFPANTEATRPQRWRRWREAAIINFAAALPAGQTSEKRCERIIRFNVREEQNVRNVEKCSINKLSSPTLLFVATKLLSGL